MTVHPFLPGEFDNVSMAADFGAGATCVAVDGCEPGTVSLRCSAVAVGNFSLRVVLSDEAVVGSPVSITVSPGDASALMSSVYGPGLIGGRAGDLLEVHIQAKDKYGNDVEQSGATILADFEPESLGGTIENVVDLLNGTFTLIYSMTNVTAGKLYISIGGQAAHGSPWMPIWEAAFPADASRSVLMPATTTVIRAGVSTKLATVHLQDVHGNTATGAAHMQLLRATLMPRSSEGPDDSFNPLRAGMNVTLTVQPHDGLFDVYGSAQVWPHSAVAAISV